MHEMSRAWWKPEDTGLSTESVFFALSENKLPFPPVIESGWQYAADSRERAGIVDMLSELPEIRSTRYALQALRSVCVRR